MYYSLCYFFPPVAYALYSNFNLHCSEARSSGPNLMASRSRCVVIAGPIYIQPNSRPNCNQYLLYHWSIFKRGYKSTGKLMIGGAACVCVCVKQKNSLRIDRKSIEILALRGIWRSFVVCIGGGDTSLWIQGCPIVVSRV